MSETPGSAEVLNKLVLDCTMDLFAAYSVALRHEPYRPLNLQTEVESRSGGVIGFTSDCIAGTLLLVAPFELLASCRPTPHLPGKLSTSSAADWILVRDWSMELTNQLLGRIRNRLNEYGFWLEARVPTAVSGPALLIAIRARNCTPLQFATPGRQALRIWFDAKTGARFDMAAARMRNAPAPQHKEGDLILF
jgi:hypothetical protein